MARNASSEMAVMGFLIEDEVMYDCRTARLVCISGAHAGISLRKTQSSVLEYLMTHATRRFVSDQELMLNIWDNNGLCSSHQRVWQVINNLKNKLKSLGVSDEFILRTYRKGYVIRKEKVAELYGVQSPDMAAGSCHDRKK